MTRGTRILAVVGLAVAASAVQAEKAIPLNKIVPGAGFSGSAPGSRSVAPPHPSGAAVIELLEDEAGRLARHLNPGPDQETLGRAGPWGDDCFSGATCIKVAGYQRFREQIPGWQYPIQGQPKAGEYRYIRFAWKVAEPRVSGIMLQLCISGSDWGRYLAGENAVGFNPALAVSGKAPTEWVVVTRDLWADFGQQPFTLTGIAFTSMNGVALFDHMYLGRTVEDLDKVTGAARAWARKGELLSAPQLEALWKDIGHDDAAIRMPATWRLAACSASSVPFVAAKLSYPDAAKLKARIAKDLADLDAPRFAVRERASRELVTLGLTALPELEALLRIPDLSTEARDRAEKIVEACRADPGQLQTDEQRLTLRALSILEMAEALGAVAVLEKLAGAGLVNGLDQDAKAAHDRSRKRLK